MNPDRWRKIDKLFESALELTPDDRTAFLDQACAGDADLRRAVEKLLRIDENAGSFVETPLVGTPTVPESGSIDGARYVAGDLIAERYRVVGLLGRGGMGEVYRADDLKLKQPVALKFLPERLSTDGAALARFFQEVTIARQIAHPHVCRVYDIGEAAGQHFISMELVRGEELSSLLKRIGRLPEDKAVEIARQLCEGLAAIHDRGVLHRDLKPANVMLDEQGDIRITDFGIAALAGSVSGREAKAGTPAYMSPEQLEGGELTTRSDLYSLGLVLYEVFTGRRAFEASTLDDLMRLRRSDTEPTSPSSLVPGLDPAVERVIRRCLERDPEQRSSSALAVAAALPGGDPLAAAIAAGETPSPEMVAASPAEHGFRPAVGAALLVFVLAGVAALVPLSDKVLAIRAVPLEKPPEVLADRARTVLAAAGLDGAPADTAYGLEENLDLYQYVVANDRSAARWERLAARRMALLYFWYRQSPRPLEPAETAVTATDPPPHLYSGMAHVRLDTLGRLLELGVVPPEVDSRAGAPAEPDWRPLFAAAELDPAAFTRSEPLWTPPVFADIRAAWEGAVPGTETPLRVEAAGYRGQPVFFKLVAPWQKSNRMEPYQTDPNLLRMLMFIFVVFVAVVVAGLWLARRNVRLGRGDGRGAARIATFAVVCTFLGELVGASHVPTFQGEVSILFVATLKALFYGALLWLLYIALEPSVRRRTPHRLVSWTRLLAGRWRDPIVGRDLLVGAALGVLMNLLVWLAELSARALGWPPDVGGIQMETLGGIAGVAQLLAGWQPVLGLFHGLGFVFLLLLLALVLRGERRAAVGAWALFMVAFVAGGADPVYLGFMAVLAAVYVFVTSRFGMLAIAAAQYVFFTIEFLPYTSDVTAWYAGTMFLSIAVVAGIALYGFWTGLGGQPLVRGTLLEE